MACHIFFRDFQPQTPILTSVAVQQLHAQRIMHENGRSPSCECLEFCCFWHGFHARHWHIRCLASRLDTDLFCLVSLSVLYPFVSTPVFLAYQETRHLTIAKLKRFKLVRSHAAFDVSLLVKGPLDGDVP